MENAREFVGIDVAKQKLDVYVHPVGERLTFSNDDDGLRQLIKWLLERKPRRVVFESTGGYTRKMQLAFEEAGVAYHCVSAQRVRAFALAIGIKAKTDEIDAEVIAVFGSHAKLGDKAPVSPAQKRLRDLVIRRAQLVRLRARERNHKESMPAEVRTSWEAVDKTLSEHIRDLDTVIVKLVNDDAELLRRVNVLTTIKGAGIATCATLLSLLPELGTVSGKQIASLVGVAPFNNQSALADNKRRCFGGRKRVRTALYMPMLTALRLDEVLAPFHERLLAKGKEPKVALVAVLRKFLVIANARMRDYYASVNANVDGTQLDEGKSPPLEPAKAWKPRFTAKSHTPRKRKARKTTPA